MLRIIWHHTAGGYHPNAVDRAAYHRLIDGEGVVHDGLHPISANAPGKALVAGQYAAHCLNLNSGSIGVAVCAMANAVWSAPATWTHPVKAGQVDALIRETARLCVQYGITPGPRTTLSHAEVQPTLGVAQKNKWDFDYSLPGRRDGSRDPQRIGDELRAEVVAQIAGRQVVATAAMRPTLRQGDRGADVLALQSALGVTADGAFGPRTRSALVAYQSARQLLPDGVCGPATWAALETERKVKK